MFKVAGPLWAQAKTAAWSDNVFKKLVKSGREVLERVFKSKLQQPQTQTALGKDVPKPSWTLGAQLVQPPSASTSRLIGGLFPSKLLKSQAAELRKLAALRLIRDARKVPVFAFVGLSFLGASNVKLQGDNGSDILYSGIQELFQQHGVKSTLPEASGSFSLETLRLGELIGKGCNAAVFEAKCTGVQPACNMENGVRDTETTIISTPFSPPRDQDNHIKGICEENAPSSSLSSKDEDDDTSFCVLNDEEDASSDSGIDKEQDHDSSFCIINEDDEDDDASFTVIDEDDAENQRRDDDVNPDSWVLYRVSAVPNRSSDGEEVRTHSDSDEDDIFILATDDEGLEHFPEECNDEPVTNEGTQNADRTSPSETTDDQHLGPTEEVMMAGEAVTANDLDPFPLAVKMMFNYGVESREDALLLAMGRETLPVQGTASPALQDTSGVSMPPHPHVVDMYGAFVDQVPPLTSGMDQFPSALPPRLNQHGGLGRNTTLFLVMKKYNVTLREFLAQSEASMRTRCLLFAQLLEGVQHMSTHGVAHRDLKADNILLDLSAGTDVPALVISDFGCCLADPTHTLTLPFPVQMDRGGNCSLMAPEIKGARPGRDSVLDYRKADLWAAGALAYEIFGRENPFYTTLDARDYAEQDLPPLPEEVPDTVQHLVKLILQRDPSKRPSPSVAATCLQLFLWAPAELQPAALELRSPLWQCRAVCEWLQQLALELVCRALTPRRHATLETSLKMLLLSRVSRQEVLSALALC